MAAVAYRKVNPNRLQQDCPITRKRGEDGVEILTRRFEDVARYFIGREGVHHMVAKLYKISVDEAKDALDGYGAAKSLHEEAYAEIKSLKTDRKDLAATLRTMADQLEA